MYFYLIFGFNHFSITMKKTNALRLLDRQKIAYSTLEYNYDNDNLDVAKIASDNSIDLETIYKTLVLSGDKSGVIVALVAGNRNLSLKKLATVSANKKVDMVPIKKLQNLTGYIRGGCSPLGMKKAYPLYLDETAKSKNSIFVNAGAKGLLFSCCPLDLQQLTDALWADISE